jgi:hypothetical protein
MKIKSTDSCPCGSGKTYGECHVLRRREKETPETQLFHVGLAVIPPPDPGTRAVFEGADQESTVLIAGIDGRHSLDCGNCHLPLSIRVERNQFQGIVFRCSRCGAYNDT